MSINMPKYQHAEAFCLMTYRAEDGSGEEEVVWNSRDGVTPFVLTLRSGKVAQHVDWSRDIRAPDYQPPKGSRIFVDLTPERSRELWTRRVEEYLADPEMGPKLIDAYGSREAAIRELSEFPEGAPDLIEVTE